MKIKSIEITNYKNYINENIITFNDYNVLIGKNNQGKSNIFKAIMLCFSIIKQCKNNHTNIYYSLSDYNYDDDYPKIKNLGKTNISSTEFVLKIELNNDEVTAFNYMTSYNPSSIFKIKIVLENHTATINMIINGREINERSIIGSYCDFINSNLFMQYISAVRMQKDTIDFVDSIIDLELKSIKNEEYLKARKIVDHFQKEQIHSLEKKLTPDIKTFLPNVKQISFVIKEKVIYGNLRDIDVLVNDGVETSLSKKGDGVKSLFYLALLSKIESYKNKIILIDEPENHLHPEAIHHINSVINELSKNNQVIISSHNPIFVDRLNVSNNIIVNNGTAYPAKRIDDIRKNLGVRCSDNLIYGDYVLITEGNTDKELLKKYIEAYYPNLNKLLKTNKLVFRVLGGLHNLTSEIYSLDRFLCNYLIILDYDQPAKEAINNLKNKVDIKKEQVRYFSVNRDKDSELEDLYNTNFYEQLLMEKDIDIKSDKFKNKSKKWSDRVSLVANSKGIDFRPFEEDIKKDMARSIPKDVKSILKDESIMLLDGILSKIEQDLKLMNILL